MSPGPTTVQNSSFAGRDKNKFSEPTIRLDGTCNTTLKNNIIAASPGGDAIEEGLTTQTVGDRLIGNTISNTGDGNTGLNIISANGLNANGGSITADPTSTTAVGLNASGATSSILTTIPITAPTPIICPTPGLGNRISGNPGAANCP